VHKRGYDSFNQKFVKEFMAYSPLYDQNVPEEANRPSAWEGAQSFQEADDKEVAYPPSPGSYHIYHLIDGELVAIGICDFTNKYFNSAYFMYKTKYSFLNLGVVGAVVELELCR
jgi:arginyl-tRNA--protein-N-Asp/Glu arginylyltransferase